MSEREGEIRERERKGKAHRRKKGKINKENRRKERETDRKKERGTASERERGRGGGEWSIVPLQSPDREHAGPIISQRCGWSIG